MTIMLLTQGMKGKGSKQMSVSELPSSDVDADIDGLLQQDEDQGKPTDPSNSPPGESDILGSIA